MNTNAYLLIFITCLSTASGATAVASPEMSFITLSPDGQTFVLTRDDASFTPWGFNYDHDDDGLLLEDYWRTDWPRIEEDFREMKQLGANVVRIHLQLARFMPEPDKPDTSALDKLTELLQLAEHTGLYLDITGLGCYHKKDVPPWYDNLSERDRWTVQARFWQAIARTCAHSPAVFCYDLMNEPVLPGPGKKETEWLLGEFGGKHFVQRITLDLAGRTTKQVAAQWVDTLVSSIRKHDPRHLVTVGVIPWVLPFPKARPLFYSHEVATNLDFASVHFYPESGQIEKALTALKYYDIAKPLVIEEMFPLKCTTPELRQFILDSRPHVDGWISFYWGKTIQEYKDEKGISAALIQQWLTTFKETTKDILIPITTDNTAFTEPHVEQERTNK